MDRRGGGGRAEHGLGLTEGNTQGHVTKVTEYLGSTIYERVGGEVLGGRGQGLELGLYGLGGVFDRRQVSVDWPALLNVVSETSQQLERLRETIKLNLKREEEGRGRGKRIKWRKEDTMKNERGKKKVKHKLFIICLLH